MFIPNPDLDILPIPDPWIKKADPGSAALLRTVFLLFRQQVKDSRKAFYS
jgi:hypothetical protein